MSLYVRFMELSRLYNSSPTDATKVSAMPIFNAHLSSRIASTNNAKWLETGRKIQNAIATNGQTWMWHKNGRGSRPKSNEFLAVQKRYAASRWQSIRLMSDDVGDCGGGDAPVELCLEKVLLAKIPVVQDKVKRFRAEYGKTKLGDIHVSQLYGGMRDMMTLIWEPSVLDADDGIRFRGLTVSEALERLPKASDSFQPLPEAMFWLLLTGEVPTKSQATAVSREWAARAVLPAFVKILLNTLPRTMHPMTQLSIAVTALSQESKFRAAYASGAAKTALWKHAYDDSMDLIAKLPLLAARIYNNTYRNGIQLAAKCDPNADWSMNFARLLGYDAMTDFVELLRLYLTLHCDHEGGNVSAHATHLVGSALGDPFLAYAAGLNGLAGPLHGLANQEALCWLRALQKEVGVEPSDKQLEDYVQKTLKAGKVVPGYGHAVLRRTDPRFLAQHDFALKHMPNDELFKLVTRLYKIVPPILKKLDKVSNPYPNVDAHSGVLLQHYGMRELDYFTVLFGVSRALGVLAQFVWSRALCLPIERPKSISTDYLYTMLKELDKHKKVLRI